MSKSVGRFMVVESRHPGVDLGRVDTYTLKNKKSGAALGHIHWYELWGEWVLSPIQGSVFDARCLRDVIELLRELE